jgi:hypothetical protein
MSVKQLVEDFQQLPPATQVALVVFMLLVVVLVVFFPAAGTSIITFLVALKMLASQQSNR